MIIINITVSFADAIQKSALEWILSEYLPLVRSCPLVTSSDIYKVDAQQNADDCFALQIRFNSAEAHAQYVARFQQDFESALFAKFTNQFGMFKTVLTSL